MKITQSEDGRRLTWDTGVFGWPWPIRDYVIIGQRIQIRAGSADPERDALNVVPLDRQRMNEWWPNRLPFVGGNLVTRSPFRVLKDTLNGFAVAGRDILLVGQLTGVAQVEDKYVVVINKKDLPEYNVMMLTSKGRLVWRIPDNGILRNGIFTRVTFRHGRLYADNGIVRKRFELDPDTGKTLAMLPGD